MFAPELVGQGRVPVLQFRQHHLHGGPRRYRRPQFPQRRTHRQGRRELPVWLGWPGCLQILIRRFVSTDAKRPASRRPFCLAERRAERAPRAFLRASKNNFRGCTQLFVIDRAIMVQPAGWTYKHACFCVRADLFRSGVPCLAQTVLKSEPLILAPYEVAFVQDASCRGGKVLKVTGAIRGLQRRKACVTLAVGTGIAGHRRRRKRRDCSASDVVARRAGPVAESRRLAVWPALRSPARRIGRLTTPAATPSALRARPRPCFGRDLHAAPAGRA